MRLKISAAPMKIFFICFLNFALYNQKSSAESGEKVYLEFGESYQFNREDGLLQYIDHPTLASGLVTGARTINQSVDSLMESIFYNLMDQQFPLPLGDNFSLVTQYERNLHETAYGSYIVVDQFRLGPRFNRDLGSFQDIPIRLGAEAGVDIINVSHRSDAARAAEQLDTPVWQSFIQNWFGIIPLLTRILPPSFNPLEMYDPISYLKTPFLFPESAEDLEQMPIGSIRSIGLSGGISISVDILEPELERIRQELRLGELQFNLPYGVFKTGIHRLHVLKKTEKIVWLAITDQRDLGHKIETNLRNNFKIFSQLIPIWEGIRAPVFPIDYLLSQAKVKRFDELYSFDLRLEKARQAFTHAVKGNLIPASSLAKNQDASGVIKYFDRTTSAFESYQKTTRSFYVQHEDRRQTQSRSIVTINDDQRDHYYLEVEQITRDTDWNVLVGAERVQFDSRLVIKVLKNNSADGQTHYLFDPEDPAPFSLMSSLSIQDRFLDAKDYHKALNTIRYFTLLPLDQTVPNLPILANDQVQEFYQDFVFVDPMLRHQIIEPTPIHLGRLYSQARIYFPYKTLMRIRQSNDAGIRLAVRASFSKEPLKDSSAKPLHLGWHWLRKSASLLLRPLRLLNFRLPILDFSHEEDRLVAGIMQLKQASNPIDFTAAFEDILDTPYPAQLVRSLLYLSDISLLPRRVEFTAQPKISRHDSPDTKKAKTDFAALDQTTIEAGPVAPQALTYQYVKEKLAAFTPDGQELANLAPRLLGAYLQVEKQRDRKPFLQITLNTQPTQPNLKNLFIYLRLEQGGSVNIGRFTLGEQILPIPIEASAEDLISQVRFTIGSEKENTLPSFFKGALGRGDIFDLYLSVSDDNKQWGREHVIRFALNEDGKISLL